MRWSSVAIKLWIIATLLLGLSACSALRFTYNQASVLAYWWLDGYMDFSGEQSPVVRAALDDYFAWHRSTQLPDYVRVLQRLQPLAADRVSPAQVCAVADEVQGLLEAAYEQAVPAMADIVRSLSSAQIDHLAKRYNRELQEAQRDYLQADPQERQEAALKRVVDRAESVYGPLDESQRALLAEGLQASPFDPRLWLAERRARQQDILRSLRQLQGTRAEASAVQAALRAFAANAVHSPRADYRAYRQRLVAANCSLAAQLHNSLRPAQRQNAVEKLKGWAEDARALAKL